MACSTTIRHLVIGNLSLVIRPPEFTRSFVNNLGHVQQASAALASTVAGPYEVAGGGRRSSANCRMIPALFSS
jgi:hypothetical protein